MALTRPPARPFRPREALAPLLALALLPLAPPRAAAISAAAETAAREGLMLLYDLDYPEFRARMRRLIEAEPDQPYGYFFEAAGIWWQSAAEFGLFKDAPALEGLFEADIEKAIRLADRIKDDAPNEDKPARADAHFILGMSYGARGQWNLLRKRYMKAYFDGRRAVKQLNKCVKLAPDFYDAYLGLGVYDYQAGRLPGVLKLSGLVGVRGDIPRGLERLRLASERGRFSSWQAAQFLSSIYILDYGDWRKGHEAIRRLRTVYPESAYFQALDAMALHRLGDFDGSLREARRLFDRAAADPAILGRKQLSLLCGLTGEACLEPRTHKDIEAWLDRAIRADEAGSPHGPLAPQAYAWRALLRFYRGAVRDMSGRRAEALDDYRAALTGPGIPRMVDLARSCMRSPCSREEALRLLKTLSLEPPGPAPSGGAAGAASP